MPSSGALLAALTLTLVLLVAPARAADPVFSETPEPGWAPVDGIVYASTTVGSTVVVGGSFTRLSNSTTGQVVTRNRIAAFDRDSGALLPGFAAGADRTVRALATDGQRVFAGGAFTSIGGRSRSRVAALDPGTGAALAGFTASASSTVFALAQHDGRLYLGGWFAYVNGAWHPKLAAVDASTGALVPSFTGSANDTVTGLAVVPGTQTLAVAGAFSRLGSAARRFLGSVRLDNGAPTAWAPPADCSDCSLLGVAAGPGLVYGAVAGPGGRASAWSATTGQRRWSQWGDGDVQAVRVVGDTLYAGGHFAPRFGASGGSATQRVGVAAMDALTGAMLPWDPPLAGPHGVWTITGDATSLWLGGGHTSASGRAWAGRLTRFRAVGASGPAPSPSTTLVPAGATWAYSDTGRDLGTGWRARAYDDGGWPRGAAQLGFGDGDERTVLADGALTYYLRRHFEVTDPASVRALTLRFLRDDGVVVYLNGTEVTRDNMPTGPVTATTRASVAVAGAAESDWHSRTVDPSLLRAGDNVLAVEVHNSSPSSSDISFDAALDAG